MTANGTEKTTGLATRPASPAPLARRDASLDTFEGRWRMSKALRASGFLPDAIRSDAQAFAVIQLAYELDLAPMTAFRCIDVIQNKPAISPEGKLALAYKRVPGFALEVLESDTKHAKVRAKRDGIEWVTISFGEEDARAAGLLGKKNYSQWPANMYRWRAIGFAIDVVAPDASVRFKTPDELGAETDQNGRPVTRERVDERTGEVTNAEFEEVPAVPPEPEPAPAKFTPEQEAFIAARRERFAKVKHPAELVNWWKKHEEEVAAEGPEVYDEVKRISTAVRLELEAKTASGREEAPTPDEGP